MSSRQKLIANPALVAARFAPLADAVSDIYYPGRRSGR